MNPSNRIELEGTVHGVSWTSYDRGQQGRVNFWLAVSRDLAGEGFDLLLCAIEPQTGEELRRLDREIRDGRCVRIVGHAHSSEGPSVAAAAQPPRIVFVADQCAFDQAPLGCSHHVGLQRRHHAHGKAAAAGDIDQASIEELLPLEVQK